MIRHLVAFALLIGAALSSQAVTTNFVLKAESPDFRGFGDAASYTNSLGAHPASLPGTADVIVLADDSEYRVSCGGADFNALNGIGLVVPKRHSRIVFADAAASDDHTLLCAISSGSALNRSDYLNGEIVKEGPGRLTLGSTGRVLGSTATQFHDYYAALTVREGILSGVHCADTASKSVAYGIVSISNDATFVMSGSTNSSWTMTICGLNGGGVLTNDIPKNGTQQSFQQLNPYAQKMSEAGWFTGAIGGLVLFVGSGPLNLAGTESSFTSSMQTKLLGGSATRRVEDGFGVIGVGKFGSGSNQPSSIGKANIVYVYSSGQSCGGGFRYLGTGETTDKQFKFRSTAGSGYSSQPAVLDGGETGNLNFTGLIQGFDAYPMALYIRGSNAAPCKVLCPVYDWSSAGVITTPATATRYPLHIRKLDPGVWEFSGAATNSTNSGAWTIDEGTVRFASVGEVGETSALGTATNLLTFAVGNAAVRTEWAVTLGGTDRIGRPSEGTLEYVGDSRCVCTTRKVALAGDGRLTASGAGSLRWNGFTGTGTGMRTLTLDGDAASEYYAGDIADGADAAVSVCKTGSGTWRLGGNLSFSGGVTVSNGTLVIDHPDRYSWYRLLIKELHGTASTSFYAQLRNIALFSADGEYQNEGLVENASASTHVETLLPGQVAIGCQWYTYSNDRPISNAFGSLTETAALFTTFARVVPVTRSGQIPVLGLEDTWIPVVMRVRDDAKPVAKYDFRSYILQSGEINPRELQSWTMQGSKDGINWTDLHSVVSNMTPATAASQWYSSHKTSFDISTAYPGEGSILSGGSLTEKSIGTIAVSPGATLKAAGPIVADGLKLDVAGAGSIEGIAFGEAGTIEVLNLPKGEVTIPVDFSKCSGWENIGNWTLKINGRVSMSRTLSVTESGVTVSPKGLIMIFR